MPMDFGLGGECPPGGDTLGGATGVLADYQGP
jgi:hypothetical protein